MDDTLKLASVAGVKHLLLAHHDPSHTDEKLVELYTEIVRRTNYTFKYELAREGMEINLD